MLIRKIFGGTKWSTQFSNSKDKTKKEVLNISKREAASISVTGSNTVDGISNDYDQIVLWLRPRLTFAVLEDTTMWGVDNDYTMDLIHVYVGHLKDPSKMPSGTAQALASAGITEDEYSEILQAYPFYNKPAVLDQNRFKYVNTYPFQPPYNPGDTPISATYSTKFNTSGEFDSTVKNEYSVDVKTEGDLGFLSFADVGLKRSNKFTWTDIDTRKSSSSETETMTFTIRGPSYGYTGPTAVKVYYDVVYKTFAFIPR